MPRLQVWTPVRGTFQKPNFFFQEGGPLIVQASPRWVSVLGTHLYQGISWCFCERLHSASVNFFEDSFNALAHFMVGDLRTHLPTLCWVFNRFSPKTAWPPCPTLLPISPHLAPSDVFLFPHEKSPPREMFCWDVEEVKQKTTKRQENLDVRNCFEQWKNVPIGVLHQMESTLKVTEVLIYKNKYTIFY